MTGNDFKIDSSNLVVGRVGAKAAHSIFLMETVATSATPASRALNLLYAQAFGAGTTGPCPCGDGIRITVRDSAVLGEDLDLIWPSAITPFQNNGQILVVENTPQVVPHGIIDAPAGWVNLRAGDNITLGGAAAPIATSTGHACGTTCPDAWLDPAAKTDALGNTQVLAGKWIDIFGDFHGTDPDPDAGYGTVMHLHGTITPGPLTTACANEVEPGPRLRRQPHLR